MKTAEEILKSKLDGKITFVNNPDYTFNKVIEAMEEYRLQSHPSPMSAEQVEELAERRASEFYDRESDSESVLNENALWQNRRDNFIAGYNAATTPSVKADGWVSVEDGLPECNEKFGDSDYYSCKDENSSGTPFVAWYNNKTNVWKLAHHAVPNISVNVTHYRSL